MNFNLKITLLLGYCTAEFVKHYRGDLFICDSKVPAVMGRSVQACNEDMTRWLMDQQGDDAIVHSPKDKGVWEVGQSGFLKINRENIMENQKFRFESVGNKKYQIKIDNKCIEYNLSRNQYDLNNCAMKYEQFFTIHDELPITGEDLVRSHSNYSTLVDDAYINSPFDREGKVYHFTCKDGGYHYRGHNHHSLDGHH